MLRRNIALLCAVASLSTGCSVLSSGPEVAGPLPSASAKMVCAPAARPKLDQVLSATALTVTKPTWHEHLYSCTYAYPQGDITLSVKELSSQSETSAYFDGLAKQYGKRQSLFGLGQGAFLTSDGSVVVRKDYKVLFVDSAKFSQASSEGSNYSGTPAEAVASTILECWSGH